MKSITNTHPLSTSARVILVIKWTLKVQISYPRGLEVLSNLEFEHPDYKGSSLFRRPNRMWNKINLTEIEIDLKLILKSTKQTTT